MALKLGMITAVLFAAVAGTLPMQEVPPKVTLTVPKTVAAGKEFRATVTVTFSEGLHGYSNPPTDPFLNPVKFAVADPAFKLVRVTYPKGVVKDIQGKQTGIYEGSIKIELTLRAPSKPGKPLLRLRMDYQQCTETTCYPPSSMALKSPLVVN
jgi:hypothetical protein